MPTRTIRGRITLWAVLIAIVLASVAAVAFRAGVDTIVATSTHTLLTSNGSAYEADIRAGTTKGFPQPGEDQFLAVLDPDGAVAVTSLPDSLEDRVHRLALLRPGLNSVRISSKLQYDVVNELVEIPGGTWHIIEARNSESGQDVLNGLTLVLAIGVVLLVIGFGVSTWLISGLALRPVTRMREQASVLSHSSTADILPVGPVPDELSALAETLNAFITSVRSSADRERQMVADASHELRTPIAVLRTQLQLAHLSAGDAVALEREISAAEGTLDRLSTLATNLLTLSRIESEDPPPATASESLLGELLASMDRAIVLGSTRAVSVDFTHGAVGGGAVAIRPIDFGGLVDNLVANAIAASPRGATVSVRLEQDENDLVLTVVDSGHGMPPEFLQVAFDRFSRASASRPREVGGSGLGLAIVRAIVTRSGGEAVLEPRPEGGLRVRVRLPLVQDSPAL